jgi:riboflavin kinase / FMN adenylyltransferase
VNGTQRRIEVNIFNFDRDIYGKKLIVSIHSFIRDEKKFDGLNSLKIQLANDQEAAMLSLGV